MWIQVSTAPHKRALKDKGEEERRNKKNPAPRLQVKVKGNSLNQGTS